MTVTKIKIECWRFKEKLFLGSTLRLGCVRYARNYLSSVSSTFKELLFRYYNATLKLVSFDQLRDEQACPSDVIAVGGGKEPPDNRLHLILSTLHWELESLKQCSFQLGRCCIFKASQLRAPRQTCGIFSFLPETAHTLTWWHMLSSFTDGSPQANTTIGRALLSKSQSLESYIKTQRLVETVSQFVLSWLPSTLYSNK